MIAIHPHEATLQRAKTTQRDPDRQQAYRQTRPPVERKVATSPTAPGADAEHDAAAPAHPHGVVHRAAAVNLARLTSLGPHGTPTGWAIT